ncbi:MAG: FAD:protein FMN transferase [Candidatus Omnitrophota bacterium]
MKSALIVFLTIFLTAGCSKPPLYKDTRIIMGTTVEVISPYRDSAGIVFAEVQRLDKLLSRYNPESEVSLLNKKGELKVSRETMYVLKEAKEFWSLSDGAFDVTVVPLLDIWGFTEQDYRVPSEVEIRKALGMIGSDKIIFNEGNNVVKFKVPGPMVDLGAIAKGFAVDSAVKKLKERGIGSCLINAGGDIYCLGVKSGAPWSVAVQDPRRSGFADYLRLKDCAVATSGDYRQFFQSGKRRYSHIMNPRTGYPADSGVVSVTVIAPDCLTADALATAIFILGKEKGARLAEKFRGVKVMIIQEEHSAGAANR